MTVNLDAVTPVNEADPAFWEGLKKFSHRLSCEDDFLVVSHHDADGITACAIMVDLLRHLGKKTQFVTIKQLDSLTIKDIKDRDAHTIVFTDMGSGQLTLLDENNIENFFVVDHHNPERDDLRQINPHTYGYDGGSDISGAGMAYLVAKSLGRASMAHIAVVGAVGDMQDSEGKLHSLNRAIIKDAVAQGSVLAENDLSLFGRHSRMLTQMLAYASDPTLPGLTGNQKACGQFLQSLGISLKDDVVGWRSYVDLTHLERKNLITALYIHLLDYNTPEFVIQRMIGEVYTLVNERERTELRDAKEYATLLNACGRQDKAEVGVRVCLGDRGEALGTAKRLLESHRRMLRDGLNYLAEKGVKSMDFLYYFDGGGKIKESIIGVIAGMAYGARIIPPDKPVLAFAVDKDDPEMIKVSSRANWGLVHRGIHLGNAMSEQSKKLGGEGGGHDIAAGARIPKDKKNFFLAAVNNIFREQLNSPAVSKNIR